MTNTKQQFRAYDLTTGWMSKAVNKTAAAAQKAADKHNRDMEQAGGYGSAIVVVRNGDRCVDLNGQDVWPSYGQSNGAVRWK